MLHHKVNYIRRRQKKTTNEGLINLKSQNYILSKFIIISKIIFIKSCLKHVEPRRVFVQTHA